MNIVISAFTSAFNWFFTFINSLGMYSYFIGVIFIMLIVRFIIAPLLPGAILGAASDAAGKLYKSNSKRKENKKHSTSYLQKKSSRGK